MAAATAAPILAALTVVADILQEVEATEEAIGVVMAAATEASMVTVAAL
jgi:hypothetical protein